jgi:hypothetical protein
MKVFMSRDERLAMLVRRFFVRWMNRSPLLDRPRWNRLLDAMEKH